MAVVAQFNRGSLTVPGLAVPVKLISANGNGNGYDNGSSGSASGRLLGGRPLGLSRTCSEAGRPAQSRIAIAAELGDKSRRKGQITPSSASASAPVLEISADSSEVPSSWHSPDVWKDTLANLSTLTSSSPDFIADAISEVRGMFKRMRGGEISVSAYDTAWVALVPALDGSANPQFPKSLDWIVNNQLEDGSWGDADLFSAYDRALNTVACMVALQTWGVAAGSVKRGCDFVNKNIHKIADEQEQHMPIGFEIVFPGVMDFARKLGLDLPYDSAVTKSILVERERKLRRIPVDFLHAHPSTLLHSLEGIQELVDWKRILKLQSSDGSMLYSPAATACALMHTGDAKCLEYLTNVLDTFDNAVPNVYPVDMFERMWMVDRLQRLGIAHHFQKEIKACLDYVYKYWAAFGLAWAKESVVTDVDDTAMGFRLLRQHGYDVSQDVFLPFRKDDDFFCFAGQSGQAVTGMFNLYRASQTLFPGETLLEQARAYSRRFLEDKLRNDDVSDKWIVTKDLPGEVEYALKYPFYASLPRIETRAYLDHYGPDDIWIGKSLYKMSFVNNPTFLALAKADFNYTQKRNQRELENIVRWNSEQQFQTLPFARQKAVECYFSAAATMVEPALESARKVWAQNGVLTTVIDDYFDNVNGGITIEELRQFRAAVASWDPALIDSSNQTQRTVFMGLYNTVNAIAVEAFVAQGRDVTGHLLNFYKRWIDGCIAEAEWANRSVIPQWDEYMAAAEPSIALEVVMQPPMFFVGEQLSDDVVEGDEFNGLAKKVNVIGRLLNDIQGYLREASQGKANSVLIYLRDHPGKTEEEAFAHLRDIIDSTMQELTYEVMQPSTEVPQAVKKVFYDMARIMHLFYKDTDGYTSISAMKQHVKRVLFEPVV